MRKFTLLKKAIIIYRKLSLILGILIPIVCFLMIPDISIINDPLSRFGIEDNTRIIWIIFNILMAFALFSIGYESNKEIEDATKRKMLNYLISFSSMFFALSGVITMDIKIPHLTLAGLFFLSYTAYIFWYGMFCKYKRLTLYSMILTCVTLVPAIPTFAMDISYGTFEVVFISVVVTWNYLLIYSKRFFYL